MHKDCVKFQFSGHLPTIFMVVELLPVFPIVSVAVHVCTPLSRDLNIVSLILKELELEAKQDLHVDDHL